MTKLRNRIVKYLKRREMYEIEAIKNTLETFGYEIHSEYWYPNFIGVRDLSNVNTFNDTLVLIQHRPTDILFKQFPFTTDPGKAGLENPTNKDGTAILCEGWHKEIWKLGLHKGQYEAFVQNKPVKVYRDADKDDVIELSHEQIHEGIYGINMHKAGVDSTYVDKWSYGCQVFKKKEDFDYVLNLAKSSMVTVFDYYLILKDAL